VLYPWAVPQHFTLFHTRCMGVVLHASNSLVVTSWMSSNLIQFWYYLPGHRIRFHRWKGQSHKTPWLQMPVRWPVFLTSWL
jgi:hypothetical protein